MTGRPNPVIPADLSVPLAAASVSQPTPGQLMLSGSWTAGCVGVLDAHGLAVRPSAAIPAVADAQRVDALDTAGAWLL
ncbi:MAG: hypothetical protein ABIR55_22660, partial [Burkholderiaceae bacterium]